MKVCLVTEELAGFQGSGGIGAAFYELALLLAKDPKNKVDILYCSVGEISAQLQNKMVALLKEKQINLSFLRAQAFVHPVDSIEGRAYAVYQTLKGESYDTIHFHDYKALGFYCFSSKKQGLAFGSSNLVLQMHGPTVWTTAINQSMYHEEGHLKLDHMERQCARDADYVVSPSQYLLDFLKEKADYSFPKKTCVIQNLGSVLVDELSMFSEISVERECNKVNEIVLFARHEDRKGFVKFCDAIDKLKDKILKNGVKVTFLGKFGQINGKHSGIYLANRAKSWNFQLSIYTDMHRNEAVKYLSANKNSLIVIPSEENSPYTVLEALLLNKAFITSSKGGAKELINKDTWQDCLADTDTNYDLTDKIASWIDSPKNVPLLSKTHKQIEDCWQLFHKKILAQKPEAAITTTQPLVTVGITHYERPDKLFDALDSIIQQTYNNIEIIVVDDGSKSESASQALNEIKGMFDGTQHRLIIQENAYLGAARNTVAKNAKGDYLCFLDDDDIAFPYLIEKLVKSIQYSKSDIVNCLNLFMDLSERENAIFQLEKYQQKVSYLPLGGPLSLACQENILGAATALIRKEFFDKVGGYTEDRGVGHEDYEFFFRALQMKGEIRILPEPLYLYEVGRPSMISNTSAFQNFDRVVSKIDPNLQPNACLDYIRLTVGKQARNLQAQRVEHSIAQTDFSDLALPIQRGDVWQHDEVRKQLVTYAIKIGAINAAKAFGEKSADLTFSVTKIKTEKNMQFRVLLVNKKYRELLSSLISFSIVKESHFLKVLKYYKAIFADEECHKQLGINDFNQLAKSLKPYYEGLAIEAQAARALKLKDEYETALNRLLQRDESEYLAMHSDVAAAVQNGDFKSGLLHFKSFGKKEGRVGFSNVASIDKEYLHASMESALNKMIAPQITSSKQSSKWTKFLNR
ncbi:glycosyltransferase [Endozoicomonas sp. ISHI1]|uniref:glycosyltransferase n=1 Tax=Endozoicomonas sp. ISHI1 TaxID=2825882 RepID=UPI002147A038|nr:glycosyltransferase [Endozoicomonas sp. ISHI1]